MNRRNTILIAVLINAGLLSVLLIAALTTQEEALPSPGLLGDTSPGLHKLEENPLFGDSIDLAIRKAPQPNNPSHSAGELPIPIPLEAMKPVQPSIQLPQPATSSAKEEPLVHKLPPLVPEAVPSPVSPPLAPVNAGQQLRSGSGHTEVTVKKGDTLEKIAKSSHATVDELIKLNHLSSSFLRVGQVLKIPAEPTAHLAAKPKIPTAPEKKAVESTGPEYYTVKVGDNPWTISMKHHIKVEELLRLNGLNEEKARKLKPGDRLRTR